MTMMAVRTTFLRVKLRLTLPGSLWSFCSQLAPSFVHGVCWLLGCRNARNAIHCGRLPKQMCQDERPDHAARRGLLADILLDRVPGELSSLSQRLSEVVLALALHETLPPITETALYDLLAALLLRTIYRADVARKARAGDHHHEAVLSKRLGDAVQACNIADDELAALEMQVGVKPTFEVLQQTSREDVKASNCDLHSVSLDTLE